MPDQTLEIARKLRECAGRLGEIVRDDPADDVKDIELGRSLYDIASRLECGFLAAAAAPGPNEEDEDEDDAIRYAVSTSAADGLGGVVHRLTLWRARSPEEAKGAAFDSFRADPANAGYAVVSLLALPVESED